MLAGSEESLRQSVSESNNSVMGVEFEKLQVS